MVTHFSTASTVGNHDFKCSGTIIAVGGGGREFLEFFGGQGGGEVVREVATGTDRSGVGCVAEGDWKGLNGI